jgi:hypothetical protein
VSLIGQELKVEVIDQILPNCAKLKIKKKFSTFNSSQ